MKTIMTLSWMLNKKVEQKFFEGIKKIHVLEQNMY